MTTDKKKDFLWIFSASMLILLWGSLPTWAGYQIETPNLHFRGTYFDSQDYAVHIAMMEAGRHGEWAYRLRFTTEPAHPAYIRLFYISLGHLSQVLSLPSELTFQIARWILGFAALLALYRLMRQVFPDFFWARISFILAAMGSGLGWLQLIFNWTSSRVTPIDFWLIDDYVFFSLSMFPHFAFVTTSICLALLLWLKFLIKPDWGKIAWLGLIAALTQFVNPIAFATIDASLLGAAMFSWWNTKNIRKADILALSIIVLFQVPLFAYNFMVLHEDPLWSRFTEQNQTFSPTPDYYVWGFGLFWPMAILGAFLAFRRKTEASAASIFWVVCGFLLAYAPVNIQRRFLQDITIPLAILATGGLKMLFEIRDAKNTRLIRWHSGLIILFVFLASLSSIQLTLGRIAYLQTYPESLYYPASLDQAIAWFRENAQYNDFVLASEPTSQVLAQKAGLRTYVGHEMETLDYRTKQAKMQSFFQGELPEIADKSIKWVIYGPFERRINPGFQAGNDLELVYDTQEVKIFRAKLER